MDAELDDILELQVIAEFENLLYGKDSPVAIERVQLCYNRIYGVNVLKLKLRNMTNETIYELGLKIDTYNAKNELIEDSLEYNYYGIEVKSGEIFGEDEEIVLQNDADHFVISVYRADLDDYHTFNGEVVLKEMSNSIGLEKLGKGKEKFKDKVKEIKRDQKIMYTPEDGGYYWRCTCGTLNSKFMDKCYICEMDKNNLMEILDEINEDERQRLKQEEEERRIKIEEQKRLEEQQRLEKAHQEELERLEKEKQEELERQRLELEAEAEEKARIAAEEARLAAEEEAGILKAKEERKKKLKKKILITAILLIILTILSILFIKFFPKKEKTPDEPVIETVETVEPEPTPIEEPEEPYYGKSIAVIGENLTGDDRELVLRLIGVDKKEFQDYIVVTVTNAQEHEYLDAQLGASKIGSKSLSCLLITPTEPGSGIEINMFNISYCTEAMYRNALNEVGITDAIVYIAAAKSSSGTSALTGIYLLPEYMEKLETSEDIDIKESETVAEAVENMLNNKEK